MCRHLKSGEGNNDVIMIYNKAIANDKENFSLKNYKNYILTLGKILII